MVETMVDDQIRLYVDRNHAKAAGKPVEEPK
jgi:hypothetical protein